MKSFLQTEQWAEFKKAQGFEIIEFDSLFVHKRPLPLGQNFLYIPEASGETVTKDELDKLKKLAKQHDSVFLRLELIDHYSDNADAIMKAFKFRKAFEEVQPKWRQIIDLKRDEAEILSQMKPKGRYNIRLAQRHGVKIDHYNSRDLPKLKDWQKILASFYKMYESTVEREDLGGRNQKYFEDMVDKFSLTDYLEIYIARYNEEPVAAAIIGFFDSAANYLYGGSSREHKEVMAPYLMHWQIICDARLRGMKIYDLIGRTAPGKTGKWAGVTKFKEQFGGQAVEIMGSYDYVLKPAIYRTFKLAEKMRRKSE